MGTLFRYWIVPGKLRRLPRVVRFGLFGLGLIVCVVSSLALFFPIRQEYGTDYIPLYGLFTSLPMVAYYLLPSLLCTLGLLAGATTIAPERQKQTWETLLLTQMRLTEVVHAKLLVRLAQCLLLTLPLYLPLYAAAISYLPRMAALSQQSTPFINHGIRIEAGDIGYVRVWLYLLWTTASTFGHLLAGTLLGMAVSACCRKVQTALIITGAIVAAYAGFYFWAAACYYYAWPSDENLHAHLFYWPCVPYLATSYDDNAFFPVEWKLKLIAEVMWSGLLPLICYTIMLRGCRLRRVKMA